MENDSTVRIDVMNDLGEELPGVKSEHDAQLTVESSVSKTKESPPSSNVFDFSHRKVIIYGVPKFYEERKARSLVDSWIEQLKATTSPTCAYEKVKKAPNTTMIRVTLADASMAEPLINYVNDNDVKIKSRRLLAKPDEGRKRPHTNDSDAHGEDVSNKRTKLPATPATLEELKDKIIPMWKSTPEEQRAIKMKSMIRKCGMKIVTELKQKFRHVNKNRRSDGRPLIEMYAWLQAKGSKSDPVIRINPLVVAPSPHRNKCEFTVGTSDDGKNNTKPVAGFMASGWSGGVAFYDDLPHIPSEMTEVVHRCNAFWSTTTQFPPYSAITNTGFWRMLAVRTSRRTGQCMVLVQHNRPCEHHQQETKDADTEAEDALKVERFATERQQLIDLLTASPLSPEVKVTSVFFQEYVGASVPTANHPVQHAFGETSWSEQLGDCQFNISPGAFFQTNTAAAEILYRIATQHIPSTTELLFDVCCGTGTIGLTCLKAGVTKRLVGVDICEPAIIDAQRNAERNGFDSSTARFVAGRAEHVLAQEIRATTSHEDIESDSPSNIVAVVDPAREGLHGDVVRTLRLASKIERIVYISCNPTGTLVRDAMMLCAPPTKKYGGRPFRVMEATPVDMFPMTNHCEMVLVLERLTETDENGTKAPPVPDEALAKETEVEAETNVESK